MEIMKRMNGFERYEEDFDDKGYMCAYWDLR